MHFNQREGPAPNWAVRQLQPTTLTANIDWHVCVLNSQSRGYSGLEIKEHLCLHFLPGLLRHNLVELIHLTALEQKT